MMSKINTVMWLLAAVIVVVVMVGYYLWTAKEDAVVGEPVTTKRTVVAGTVYSEEDQSKEDHSAVIDGEIIHEGDVVHGANVVKIDRGEVEFEKNGKRWRQRVQEQPKPAQPEAD